MVEISTDKEKGGLEGLGAGESLHRFARKIEGVKIGQHDKVEFTSLAGRREGREIRIGLGQLSHPVNQDIKVIGRLRSETGERHDGGKVALFARLN